MRFAANKPRQINNRRINCKFAMYSGLLPKGLTEADLSSDNEEDVKEDTKCESPAEKCSAAEGNTDSRVEVHSPHNDPDSPTCSLPGIPQEMWQVCCFCT